VGVVWQVIAMGGGPAELSLVSTGSALGLVSSVLAGGVLADRVPQRLILVIAEATKVVVVGDAKALALAGLLQIWQLALVGLVLGIADGFVYPAHSPWLPSILPAEDPLAANGIEGMLRPTISQAAGPIAASAAIAVASPTFGAGGAAGSIFVASVRLPRCPWPWRG
jgi:MFS family permease